MPHSFNKIWIHAIWATKHRLPLIGRNVESKIYAFISEQFKDQGCPVKIINGMPDHVHSLFLLSPKTSMASIIKQVKGSSSYYINQNELTDQQFAWQTGYAAYSVSESVLERTFLYIQNQKQHHQKLGSQYEYEQFLKLHGFDGARGS
jgi:REP element-mobilizing transposase RayT